jgi:hypothetical protein
MTPVSDRLAIKRLTASDCTLFEAVFRTIGAGNQKSINLNADVLTGRLYPGLPAAAAASGYEIPLPMSIYGPGGKGAHSLTRKIIKTPAYKNWRLNGEFIAGPLGDASRYDSLRPGDLAIMAFKGDPIPARMDLIIISQTDPSDAALHAALTPVFGNKSMVAVTASDIAAAAGAAAVPPEHPVHITAADPDLDAALEDAAQGGLEGTGKLLKNKSGRKVSAADLSNAKAKAELVGQSGEGLARAFLAAKVASGELASFEWASAEHAVSPFDFTTTETSGERTLIDAKATTGPFENVIHLSLAEVVEAAGEVPYRIYRVFELSEKGGKLRVSDDIGPLARHLRKLHELHMPSGVRVDGFSVATSILNWGTEQYVERPEDDEGT